MFRPEGLGFGSIKGADSLVENCKAHDLPVESDLKELLTVLPGTTDPEVIASLTPARIAAARRNESGHDRAA